jgi:hypothetical protein
MVSSALSLEEPRPVFKQKGGGRTLKKISKTEEFSCCAFLSLGFFREESVLIGRDFGV